MNAPQTVQSKIPTGVRIALVVGWIIIIAKCLATPWAIAHWQIPIHPGWVIVPTLIMAALVTIFATTHDWTSDED